MFCGLRFKFVFYQILWDLWGHFGLHLAPFLRKKPFRKSLQKKGPPCSKFPHYQRVRWLLETPPRMRASRTETIARARIQVRFQLELDLWFEFVSNLCPSLSWWQFEIEKLLENGCLSWLRLQEFRKQFEKMERTDIKTQCWRSDTPLGRSPANFPQADFAFSTTGFHSLKLNN